MNVNQWDLEELQCLAKFTMVLSWTKCDFLSEISFFILPYQAELIRESAATYVTQINELLNRVPRQLLLLLKTNDLLRSIDYRLKTSATSCSFITMSRCCIRAVTKQRLQHCRSWRDWFLIQADSTFSHFRITLYQVYVSNVVTSLRSLISRIMNGLHFLWCQNSTNLFCLSMSLQWCWI